MKRSGDDIKTSRKVKETFARNFIFSKLCQKKNVFAVRTYRPWSDEGHAKVLDRCPCTVNERCIQHAT